MEKVLIPVKCSDRLPNKNGMYKTDLLIDALFDKKIKQFYLLIGPLKRTGHAYSTTHNTVVYKNDLEITQCRVNQVYPEYWYEEISISEFKNKFFTNKNI